MNMNSIINMIMRMVMRKVISGGINAGINAASGMGKGRGKRPRRQDDYDEYGDHRTPPSEAAARTIPGREPARPKAPQGQREVNNAAKMARRSAKMAKRLTRM